MLSVSFNSPECKILYNAIYPILATYDTGRKVVSSYLLLSSREAFSASKSHSRPLTKKPSYTNPELFVCKSPLHFPTKPFVYCEGASKWDPQSYIEDKDLQARAAEHLAKDDDLAAATTTAAATTSAAASQTTLATSVKASSTSSAAAAVTTSAAPSASSSPSKCSKKRKARRSSH
ncbi:hypothetical protein G7054_g9088 [Neopestalotiopsis clavispora]|nr:hypothetical protein G7054_g9088 [Neopestalotiopsis clavispora]